MRISLLCLSLIFFFTICNAQNAKDQFSVLFYNTENFFDTRNDSLTADDEFTPEGERHWTTKRFDAKVLNLSKVILNADGWGMPDLIGLCEVENKYVLEKLITDSPLKTTPYKIIHKESPDPRGIDVALLYNSEAFYPLDYDYYPMINENGSIRRSREILHVFGIVNGGDSLHVFVNHWPSRYSGLLETRPARQQAALLLLSKYNEILEKDRDANVIIVGDFNDQPNDESISKYMGAADPSGSQNASLYNLSLPWMKQEEGTLKYQGQWFVFDQIMVSPGLLDKSVGLQTNPEKATVCKLPFLFEADEKNGGRKLFRTYTGYRYNGGFSDHLPVMVELQEN
ncbi:endonuclease [Draconibacterium sp. IB214405]|uniref:endonuclease/exonuclease/phosphatase family protein n=1 Tax=Draconibacterium sp. IB214405 TaxID=3097352 RepID=UPI002A1096A6|nr:endonuclease/exonuclease/phosphatase family protein [Draconibacterium sp. IB214405]MDX8338481.1 endonuclease [Draconibacterium sp. IB214405]